MSDPLRSDQPLPEALERESRIERLLLAGLDQYFAGEFEPAINLWTRVLFLDREHDRARAYIERARSAQAERQRASEALVHQGLAAFDAGDVGRARTLLSDAMAQGASQDEALGVMGRIERLGGAARLSRPAAWPARVRRVSADSAAAPSTPVRGPASRPGARFALLLLVAFGAVVVSVWGVSLPQPAIWPLLARQPFQPVAEVRAPVAEPLPVPLASEYALARARSWYESGRLHDSLRALDHVPIGDPGRVEADRLRAQVQRELLAVAAAAPAFSPAAGESILTPLPRE